MRTSHLRTGSIATAAISAGPIFILTYVAMSVLARGEAVPVPAVFIASVSGMLGIVFVAALFGFFIAIIPCAIGAWAMASLGSGNDGLRLPPVWAIAGGAMAALPYWMFGPGSIDSESGFALITTGAICALICRKGVEWTDDAGSVPAPPERSAATCTRTHGDAPASGTAALTAFVERKDFLR